MERAAIVTGGSSGIGFAIARMLRDEGFGLTLASRRAEKVQAPAAAELGAAAVAADVGSVENCERLVAEHRERFGRLDMLVNSAGIGIAGASRTCRQSTSTCRWVSTCVDSSSRRRQRSRCCASRRAGS